MQTIEKRVTEDFRKHIQGKDRAILCYIMLELDGEDYHEDIIELTKIDNNEDVEKMTMKYIIDYIARSFEDGLSRDEDIPSEQEYIDIINDMQLLYADGELNLNK